MKNLLFCFAAMLLLSSCDVSSDPTTNSTTITFSGTYFSKSLLVDKVRLFTAKGEILDKVAIADFIHHDNGQFYHYDSIIVSSFITKYDSVVDVSGAARIEFKANNNANFVLKNQSKSRSLKLINDVLFFEHDSISTVPGDLNSTTFFSNQIYTYKPLYCKTSFVATGGSFGSTITEIKDCSYAQGDTYEIGIPKFSFKHVRYAGNICIGTDIFSNVNNKFNEASLKLLGVNDTLAVQQFYIVLRR